MGKGVEGVGVGVGGLKYKDTQIDQVRACAVVNRCFDFLGSDSFPLYYSDHGTVKAAGMAPKYQKQLYQVPFKRGTEDCSSAPHRISGRAHVCRNLTTRYCYFGPLLHRAC